KTRRTPYLALRNNLTVLRCDSSDKSGQVVAVIVSICWYPSGFRLGTRESANSTVLTCRNTSSNGIFSASYKISAAVSTSASPRHSCKSSTSSTCTWFKAALALTTRRASASISQAVTRYAPACAAAIATTPEQLPTSSTVLPATALGLANSQ